MKIIKVLQTKIDGINITHKTLFESDLNDDDYVFLIRNKIIAINTTKVFISEFKFKSVHYVCGNFFIYTE